MSSLYAAKLCQHLLCGHHDAFSPEGVNAICHPNQTSYLACTSGTLLDEDLCRASGMKAERSQWLPACDLTSQVRKRQQSVCMARQWGTYAGQANRVVHPVDRPCICFLGRAWLHLAACDISKPSALHHHRSVMYGKLQCTTLCLQVLCFTLSSWFD